MHELFMGSIKQTLKYVLPLLVGQTAHIVPTYTKV